MLNQTERKHWLYLNRAVTKAGLGAALLSWGGTMFEYLLPQLFLPLLPGTLSGESCLNAVRAQMAADPSRPFGISESGYYAFDPEMNYQYRAFGLPLLARSGETAGKTVAPYASMLAFPLFPRAAAKNMRRMQRLGWEDGHGFFEAADWAENHRPRVVQSHMAHHQGMILCALCNALENGALTRAFMALPAAKANACLLWERAPRHARRRIALPPPRQEETAAAFPPPRPARSGLPPETQLLSGGGARWLLTSLGQGFLAAGNMMITRFDAQAGSQTGPQFYLRDRQSGAFLGLPFPAARSLGVRGPVPRFLAGNARGPALLRGSPHRHGGGGAARGKPDEYGKRNRSHLLSGNRPGPPGSGRSSPQFPGSFRARFPLGQPGPPFRPPAER